MGYFHVNFIPSLIRLLITQSAHREYPSPTGFRALKDVLSTQRFEPSFISTILVFFNTYIIPLLNHTKIEDTSFHQELYATKQYC